MLKQLSKEAYEDIIKESTVLKTRGTNVCILLTKNNLIVKHIYKRNIFSSSFFFPFSIRFIKSVKRLDELGFAVPKIIDAYNFKYLNCHILIYEYLPFPVVANLSNQTDFPNILMRLINFIIQLHTKGIYFRDLHMHNILYDATRQQFYLIDLASIKFKKILTTKQRAKNIAHFLNKKRDKPIYLTFGVQKIVQYYLQSANIPKAKYEYFLKVLHQYLKRSYIKSALTPGQFLLV